MTEAVLTGIIFFTLATFLGVELIGRVPPTLHTPLMSGANAVSGITVVGAVLVAGGDAGWLSTVLGFLAIVFAMMNVVGGYAVTDRMLGMFQRGGPHPGGGGGSGGSGSGSRDGTGGGGAPAGPAGGAR